VNILCLKCGETPTIKAHVFPQSAVRAIRTRGPDAKIKEIYSDRAIISRNQNGIYDSSILCLICDGRIGVAEKWFIENLNDLHLAAAGQPPYYPIKLLLNTRAAIQFAVSIIYRSSLSLSNRFRGISLGPYTSAAGEIATGSDQADFKEPLVMINVLISNQLDVRQFVFYPVRCSGRNGSYYVFTISGIQFLVKFGGRHFGISDNDVYSEAFRVRPDDAETIVCCYPFNESAEAEFLRDVKGQDQRPRP
jgi:hypothetical protein